MVKKRLMLGAAFAALSLIPLTNNAAVAQDLLDDYDLDIKAEWDNSVDVNLDWDVDVSKELSIYGSISIDGSITADALSQATLDDKQMLSENKVDFEDYQNANTFSSVDSEPGVGTNGSSPDYAEEGAPKFATYTNTATAGNLLVTATGNIGLNLAAGDYNLQENAAVISQTDGSFPAETQTATSAFSLGGAGAFNKNFAASGAVDFISTESNGSVTTTDSFKASGSITLALSGSGSFTLTGTSSEASARSARTSGAAEAGSFSLQSLYNNEFNSGVFNLGDGETDEQNPEIENSIVSNTASLGDGTLNAADGNVGVNIAAGAFNIQKNALVIASVTGGHLAEATTGVLQHSEKNRSVVEDVTNAATLDGGLENASGNIGVNIAAGVGNLQLNTLTIASTIATATGGTTGGGGGGGGGETPGT